MMFHGHSWAYAISGSYLILMAVANVIGIFVDLRPLPHEDWSRIEGFERALFAVSVAVGQK